MSTQKKRQIPLVYSCSGCSSAAQMANYLAVKLDRKGTAEMSCIAGVGGNVKKLVHTALSARPIIAIDGCPLACARSCLMQHAVKPALHIQLANFNVKKENRSDFDTAQANEILERITWSMKEINVIADGEMSYNYY